VGWAAAWAAAAVGLAPFVAVPWLALAWRGFVTPFAEGAGAALWVTVLVAAVGLAGLAVLAELAFADVGVPSVTFASPRREVGPNFTSEEASVEAELSSSSPLTLMMLERSKGWEGREGRELPSEIRISKGSPDKALSSGLSEALSLEESLSAAASLEAFAVDSVAEADCLTGVCFATPVFAEVSVGASMVSLALIWDGAEASLSEEDPSGSSEDSAVFDSCLFAYDESASESGSVSADCLSIDSECALMEEAAVDSIVLFDGDICSMSVLSSDEADAAKAKYGTTSKRSPQHTSGFILNVIERGTPCTNPAK
jgi:hypothetical protein